MAMQTDWGGEYQSLNSFFNKIGIAHYVSCPHAHQQNGSAERKHRHIVEVGLALHAHASMHLKFWDEAFSTAAYLINRTLLKFLHTPLHLSALLIKSLIMLSSKSLGVHVGLILGPTIRINSLFALRDAFFSAIVFFTKDISTLMSLPDGCISPVM